MRAQNPGASRAALRLFLVSFIALFLELMLIRWVPSVIKLIAYYTNLLLISSFLGLGMGNLSARRREWAFRFFPVLLAFFVLLLWATRHIQAPGSLHEARFGAPSIRLGNYAALISIFISNAAVFFALGVGMGGLFNALPTLQAYGFDLAGSLCGTVLFGLFSFFHFSPVIGMAFVMSCYGFLIEAKHRLWGLILFGMTIGLMIGLQSRGEYWSPYYYITVYSGGAINSPYYYVPPPNIKTMQDPPLYNVHVNHDFYQVHGTLNAERYTQWPPDFEKIRAGYDLPFLLQGSPQSVLVLGAGGGLDAEAAIRCGARRVDAVEIDPMIIQISKRFSASAIYEDPRVHVINTDARAVLETSKERYDVVVFGRLDSQGLFNSMANVRLDGFVYTVESLRAAFRLLNDHGLLCVSFSIPRAWLAQKLYFMVKEATGQIPTVYYRDSNIILCVAKTPRLFPGIMGPYQQLKGEPSYVPVATDDWPYLYLSDHRIPSDYAIVIGTLMMLSILALIVLHRGSWAAPDWHFFFLGMGFLLLETKSIIDCSLYFGGTWLVTNLIVAGVLLMVFLANLVALRLERFSVWFYGPLLAWLFILILVPRSYILAQPVAVRLAWTLVAVPFPVFFAGIIFSTTFRFVKNASFTFGANLLGATLGGFLEYTGMFWGYRSLSWMVLAFYLASLFFVTRWRKSL